MCRYNWHSAGSLNWPFLMLTYKYIFQIKYTEAISSNSTGKPFPTPILRDDVKPRASTLCPRKVSPLNISQQPPQTCTDLNEILHTQDDIFFVIDVKFHKNPLFCLRDVQFFQTAVTNLSYGYNLLLAD